MYLIVLVAILGERITTCHCGAIVGDRIEGRHACGSKISTQNSMRQGTTAELGNIALIYVCTSIPLRRKL
jgi:hypothetical protein